MKSLLALHFCIGIYLRKGSQSHQPGWGVSSWPGSWAPPRRNLFSKDSDHEALYSVFLFGSNRRDPDSPFFYPDSSEIPPASQELLI